jgi:hypothetical protein
MKLDMYLTLTFLEYIVVVLDHLKSEFFGARFLLYLKVVADEFQATSI